MANMFLLKLETNKAVICLFFLATSFWINANCARILDEINPHQPQVINDLPQVGPTATLPTNQIPSPTAPAAATKADEAPVPVASPTTEENPEDTQPEAEVPAFPEETPAAAAPVAASADGDAEADNIPPVASPSAEENPELPQPEAEAPVVPDETPVLVPVPVPAKPVTEEPSLSFFMHDIPGGSQPSARVVAGIVTSTDVTGLPFSNINNNLVPITGGIPSVNPNLNGVVTNNNLPLLNGAESSTVFKNRGTNKAISSGGNQPFVSTGNLPVGFTIQKLMFRSVTVIDDQLTEEQELESAVIGKALGFYLANSMDVTSHTILLNVLLHGGGGGHHDEIEDMISLLWVHRTASPEWEIAVVGGMGKYENARGYAVVESLPKEDQHTTDGVDTVLHFNVYLTE